MASALLAEGVLRGARMRGADLSGALLNAAVLIRADLRQANLRGAGLGATRLDQNAQPGGAYLVPASPREADVRDAYLSQGDDRRCEPLHSRAKCPLAPARSLAAKRPFRLAGRGVILRASGFAPVRGCRLPSSKRRIVHKSPAHSPLHDVKPVGGDQ